VTTRRGERGAVTVMTIGLFLAVALLGVVVIDASHAFLERRELDNLADGAALAAADTLDEDAFYTSGAVRVDAHGTRAIVADYLSGSGVRVVTVAVIDGRISVRLERVIDLVLAPPGFPVRTTIVAEASSELRSAAGEG